MICPPGDPNIDNRKIWCSVAPLPGCKKSSGQPRTSHIHSFTFCLWGAYGVTVESQSKKCIIINGKRVIRVMWCLDS